jgi:hypothetical protein
VVDVLRAVSVDGELSVNGDGQFWSNVAIDVALDVAGHIQVDGHIQLGATPATDGRVRLTNNDWIKWRNAANSADIQGIKVDGSNILKLYGDDTFQIASDGRIGIGVGPSGSKVQIGGPFNLDNDVDAIFETDPTITWSRETYVHGLKISPNLRPQDATGDGDWYVGVQSDGELYASDGGTGTAYHLEGYAAFNGRFKANANYDPATALTRGVIFFARSPELPSPASDIVTDLYGLFIEDMSHASVTSAWGIKQEGATNKNQFDGPILAGTTPAQSGQLRLPNNALVKARNQADSADISLLYLSTTNQVVVGEDNTMVYIPEGVEIGTNPRATTGVIRLANSDNIRARNAANSANIDLIAVNALDQVVLGAAGVVVVGTYHVLVLGYAGTLPAATMNDFADFNVPVPFDMTLQEVKAQLKTAVGTHTIVQIRRSTDQGASFSDAFGAVTISNGDMDGYTNPADLDITSGDVLQLSVTTGGGSGTNLVVELIGRRR